MSNLNCKVGKVRVVVNGKEYWSDSQMMAFKIRSSLDQTYGVIVKKPKCGLSHQITH